jgi:hypothetical protein
MRHASIALAGAALLLLAGCTGTPPRPVINDEEPSAPAPVDLWGGSTNQTLLHLDETGTTQFDVLCLLGGGIMVERDDGLVLPGSDHVQFTVSAPPTSTGVQVGYALSRDPGYDEVEQGNVTWLPIVRATTETFQVPVPAGAYENSTAERLWAFYLRMNASDETDCYTGAQVQGSLVIDIQAIKGQ